MEVTKQFQRNHGLDYVIDEYERQKIINEHLEDIIDSSYDGIVITDKNGIILKMNKASERINNVDAKKIIGTNVKELISKGYIDHSVTLEVLKSKRPVTHIREWEKGKKILITGNPILDEKGEISLVVMNERDITELDRVKDELEESIAISKRYSLELSDIRMRELEGKEIVGRSKESLNVFETAMKVSKVDSVVLLLGESGVGKGLIAGLIHRLSNRKYGPFVTVNCSAIPETLIEAELFGYDGGAFTGARISGKPGLFEIARNGTLFIDEVAEIPLGTQVKILKFLEDNEITRVGGTKPKKINVRIIAASNQDLKDMIKIKQFREDLYYRLSVVPILIPPLRERGSDIPPLINFFLKHFNEKYNFKKHMSSGAIDILCSYPYPGNVRELRNIIENLIVLTDSDIIGQKHIPKEICLKANFCVENQLNQASLHEILNKVEKEVLAKAYKEYKTTTRMAKALGLSQPSIVRKLKQYRIRDAIPT
jgi:PAS domain S-box-containing protein/TyrR family helix-turn-helix protein